MSVCVHVHVHVCVRACVCVSVSICVRAGVTIAARLASKLRVGTFHGFTTEHAPDTPAGPAGLQAVIREGQRTKDWKGI